MLNFSGIGSFEESASASLLSFSSFVAAIKRHCRAIIWSLIGCWVAAALFIALAPVFYVASTQVMLEPLPRKPMAVALDGVADPLDSAQAESRMQVVKSERLLQFVFNAVGWSKLSRAPSSDHASPLRFVVDWLRRSTQSTSPNEEESARTRSFLDFMERVSVKRLGISYVIEISFQAKSPETAAFMANAVTAAYLRSLVISSQLDDELLQRRLSNIKVEEQSLADGMMRGVIPDQYFPDANARVISAAIKPLSRSGAKPTLIVAMATVLGLSIGILLSITRHQNDRIIRTGHEKFLPAGLRLLGRFPSNKRSDRLRSSAQESGPCLINARADELLLAEANDTSALRRYKILAFVAPRSGMGTSSVALSIAERASRCGLRPTLVDANLLSPALSRDKTSEATRGLTDAIHERDRGGRVRATDLGAFDFLSIGSRAKEPCTLSSPPVGPLLKELGKKGPVFIDLPAMDSSFDALSVARHVDAFVLVVKANETHSAEISRCTGDLSGKVVGFVLNHSAASPRSGGWPWAFVRTFGRARVAKSRRREGISRPVSDTPELVEG